MKKTLLLFTILLTSLHYTVNADPDLRYDPYAHYNHSQLLLNDNLRKNIYVHVYIEFFDGNVIDFISKHSVLYFEFTPKNQCWDYQGFISCLNGYPTYIWNENWSGIDIYEETLFPSAFETQAEYLRLMNMFASADKMDCFTFYTIDTMAGMSRHFYFNFVDPRILPMSNRMNKFYVDYILK